MSYCHEPEIVTITNMLNPIDQSEDDGFVLVTKKKQKPFQHKKKQKQHKLQKQLLKVQSNLDNSKKKDKDKEQEKENIEQIKIKQLTETNNQPESSKVIINQYVDQIFDYKLTNDFQDKVNNLIMDSNRLSPLRMITIQRLHFIITQINPQLTLSFFGSTVTGLSLPTSDIDINIVDSTGTEDPQQILDHLLEELKILKWVNQPIGIFTASVPVLKLKVIPLEPFTSSCSFLDLPLHTQELYQSELIQINVDITMQSLNPHFNYQFLQYQQPKHMGELSTELVNMWLALYPPLFALTIFLKEILQQNQYNCTYKGGLSSYSLVILIIAFLRAKELTNTLNYSSILMQFCQFFGNKFNPKELGICLSCTNPFFSLEQIQPVFSDPPKFFLLDPLNESNNLTKNSYKTLQILEKFAELHNNLLSYKGKLKELLESLKLEKPVIDTAQTYQT